MERNLLYATEAMCMKRKACRPSAPSTVTASSGRPCRHELDTWLSQQEAEVGKQPGSRLAEQSSPVADPAVTVPQFDSALGCLCRFLRSERSHVTSWEGAFQSLEGRLPCSCALYCKILWTCVRQEHVFGSPCTAISPGEAMKALRSILFLAYV